MCGIWRVALSPPANAQVTFLFTLWKFYFSRFLANVQACLLLTHDLLHIFGVKRKPSEIYCDLLNTDTKLGHSYVTRVFSCIKRRLFGPLVPESLVQLLGLSFQSSVKPTKWQRAIEVNKIAHLVITCRKGRISLHFTSMATTPRQFIVPRKSVSPYRSRPPSFDLHQISTGAPITRLWPCLVTYDSSPLAENCFKSLSAKGKCDLQQRLRSIDPLLTRERPGNSVQFYQVPNRWVNSCVRLQGT